MAVSSAVAMEPDLASAGDAGSELAEWQAALDDVLRERGRAHAAEMLAGLLGHAQCCGIAVDVPARAYLNTIAPGDQPALPGDPGLQERLAALVRWNAMAMVLQANADGSDLGGHLATYQSAATLYEVGFNHFWHAPDTSHGGDLVYFQGHSAPGIYARALLEGRLDPDRVRRFRQEAAGPGLSSYPHPWLMPEFWQFPTVSMGLGPLMAIYQARFMRYLQARGLADNEGRSVWAFMGDGEMDEPESIGALGVAARERLDNLIFVVNCNLQRLDGPVRGNGKIIQELESTFRGAGWNVIKVIWGSRWDELLAADGDGILAARMQAVLDGDYQTYKARGPAYVREHFFGATPELRARVAHLTDDELWALDRGGHDPHKVYAAYRAAVAHTGAPTVILAKTVKGHGMGSAGEGRNSTHQQKKLGAEQLLALRDRLGVPLGDDEARSAQLCLPGQDSPELRYLRSQRAALGGPLPVRRTTGPKLGVPPIEIFAAQLQGSGERAVSTTMVFVRLVAALLRDPALGPRVVPIVPDESRTFGMEGMFRQLGIYSPLGQLYEPEDAQQLSGYREDPRGQILQEGINEAGAFSSWLAAATAYSNHGLAMVPFYVFYSMFGFQRVGDLAWAAGDSRARGFLIGGTAGRTTLNGEGLQHEDGHSHLHASVIPNCRAYDPAYGYELAVIVHHGLRRLLEGQDDAFYYLTVMNENYPQPPLAPGAEEAILRGMHRVGDAAGTAAEVRLLGSGAILREVLAGAELLREDFGVDPEVWSVTSFSELQREGRSAERDNRLHPRCEPRRTHVEECVGGPAPVVAATDYVRAVAEQIRPWLRGPYCVLGTDGFGRSDHRRELRRFFEVDRYHVAVAALQSLGRDADADRAIDRYELDRDAADPWSR